MQLNHSKIKTPIHHWSNFVTSSETQQFNQKEKKSSKIYQCDMSIEIHVPRTRRKDCSSWRKHHGHPNMKMTMISQGNGRCYNGITVKVGVEQVAAVGRSLCTNKLGQLTLRKQNCAQWKAALFTTTAGGLIHGLYLVVNRALARLQFLDNKLQRLCPVQGYQEFLNLQEEEPERKRHKKL